MDDYTTALFMAQAMIQNLFGAQEPVRPEMIAEQVDLVLRLRPEWAGKLDRDRLVRDLESRLNIWIGRSKMLLGTDDHVAWRVADRKQGWRLWLRYRQEMFGRLAPASLDELDRATDEILLLLEDPQRAGVWDRRGLVVGHVQSGKTANYIGLICKAADAGYKVIVVLAGMHNNLRSQTQMRLDEGFLGYETLPERPAEGWTRPIGVGLIDANPDIRPNYVTNRSDRGDFSKAIADSLGINPGDRPLLFVVKKNASVLGNLLYWVDRVATRREEGTGRPIIEDIPLLVIDDEADQASVDTREQPFDENGAPDPDHSPTKINGLVRKLLSSFGRSAYVGFTATPFANIFIHEKGRTADKGEDLFPRSFIVCLPAPSDHVGPARLFGLDALPESGVAEALPLVRAVSDHASGADEGAGWMPTGHGKEHRPLFEGSDAVPSSLRQAILAFVLACAARRARGQVSAHNSMLVHVTRFNRVQAEVRRQVENEVTTLRRELTVGDAAIRAAAMNRLRALWDDDFVPTTGAVARIMQDPAAVAPPWAEVESQVTSVVEDIRVREVNGSAGDVLDYDRYRQTGLTVIAIGGDKLSRGLTLEGLTVSYFLRASRMYDTLMQMGRWFGYRPAYLDLCRLYTTDELVEWFEHITVANEELRQEFDRMVATGGTPRDYGLRVQSHPTLLVTSQVKMRHGTPVDISFAGDIVETTVFHAKADIVSANLKAAVRLIESLGPPTDSEPSRDRPRGNRHAWRRTHLWSGAPADVVVRFLRSFATHPAAKRVRNDLLASFVETQARQGELVDWTVALLGTGMEGEYGIAGLTVGQIKRGVKEGTGDPRETGRYVIRRLLAPRDEAIDLDSERYGRALANTLKSWRPDPARSRRREPPDIPAGPDIRGERPRSEGLLLLYPLCPEPVGGTEPVVGFGISFPASSTAGKVTYVVNNTYYRQEYGATNP